MFLRLDRMKASDGFLLKGALLAAVAFLAVFLIRASVDHSVLIPATGGTFSEGIVGTPRFANPVLAVTRADRDLSALVYDGLMRLGEDGTLVPNIAKSVTVSDDGLTYNVVLRDDVKFHDGQPLTAKDVAFTVGRIEDPLLSSPLRANFDGVSVEVLGDYELNFVIAQPYAPFIENLTFGILPEHIWKDAGSDEFPFSQYNSEPVGSGPYEVESIARNASGIPETYVLKANDAYHRGSPKIKTIELHFYPSEDKLIQAFKKGTVGSVAGVDPDHLAAYQVNSATSHVERIPLPRTFAVFFDQNKSAALRDPAARKALDAAIDRSALIDAVLGGYGRPLFGPVPEGFGTNASATPHADVVGVDAARDILKAGGWEMNDETHVWEKTIDKVKTPLSFSLSTANGGTFEATAEFLKNAWEQLGAAVEVKQFEQTDLAQSVIRPRDYQALLFGMQLGRAFDFYSFWHSSQRNDPGLNIALYANLTTDSILADMRTSTDTASRNDAIDAFVAELDKEKPAVFLYSPELLYIFPNDVTGATFTGLAEPQERWSGVTDWYIKTDSVWPIFTK
ncbi:MAG TPA: peptide ABC transporter substrate-binding protein [Candidatus Paceibacterota bacterium]|nr:peptide ABC transporter substrate-binding protein [Candidatus Paceibacterota bacterium]